MLDVSSQDLAVFFVGGVAVNDSAFATHVEVLKIFKGFEDVSYNIYFTLSQSGLRSHSYKLCKPNFRLDIKKFSFSVRAQ